MVSQLETQKKTYQDQKKVVQIHINNAKVIDLINDQLDIRALNKSLIRGNQADRQVHANDDKFVQIYDRAKIESGGLIKQKKSLYNKGGNVQ